MANEDASGEENAAYSDQAPSDTVTPVDVFESDVTTKQPMEVEVAISDQDVVHDKPYSGMGKEDLVRFSDTPFWNRFRLISVVGVCSMFERFGIISSHCFKIN